MKRWLAPLFLACTLGFNASHAHAQNSVVIDPSNTVFASNLTQNLAGPTQPKGQIGDYIYGPISCLRQGNVYTASVSQPLGRDVFNYLAEGSQIFILNHGYDALATGFTSMDKVRRDWGEITNLIVSRQPDATICLPAFNTSAGIGGNQSQLTNLLAGFMATVSPSSSRPITLVGHSMGGLYQKHAASQASALLLAANGNRQRSAIAWPKLNFIYLGTPHQGALAATGTMIGRDLGRLAGNTVCAFLSSPNCAAERLANNVSREVVTPGAQQLSIGSSLVRKLEADMDWALRNPLANATSFNAYGSADVVVTTSSAQTAMARTQSYEIQGQTHQGFLTPSTLPAYQNWLISVLGL